MTEIATLPKPKKVEIKLLVCGSEVNKQHLMKKLQFKTQDSFYKQMEALCDRDKEFAKMYKPYKGKHHIHRFCAEKIAQFVHFGKELEIIYT